MSGLARVYQPLIWSPQQEMPNLDVCQHPWEAVLTQMADPHPQSFRSCRSAMRTEDWVMLLLLVWVPHLRTIREEMTPVKCSFGLKDSSLSSFLQPGCFPILCGFH